MNNKGNGNSSLLKSNNPRKRSNTKPSVSFATTASVRTVPHRNANEECSPSSSSSIPRSKGKGTSPYLRKAMNDEEDDAFDPKSFSSTNTNISSQDAEKNRIREAKAQRALKRMTDEDSYFNGDHDVSGSNIQMEVGDARRGVQGEEEVDDRYSLLALQEQEQEQEHEQEHEQKEKQKQKQKQKQQDENENENGFGNKNENSISGNTDTGTSKHQEACPIEPFNMTSEREDGEGYFDGDTYVFRRGRGGNDEDDAWLDQFQENEDAYKGNENKIQGGDDSGTGSTSTSTSTFMNLPKLKVNKLQSKDENKQIQTQSALASKSEQDQLTTKEQVYDRLLPLLASDSETVLQALGRYGTIMKREKKQKAAKRNRNRNTNTNSDSNSTNKSKEPQENASASSSVSASAIALNRLTELSSLCMMKFDDGNIYERSRGSLQQLLDKSDREANVSRKRSYFESDSNASTCSAGVNVNKNNTNGHGDKRPRGDGGADATNTATATDANASTGTPHKNGNVQWEYRGNQDNVIHGPYTTQQMLEWTKAGYFIGAAAVDIRMVMGANDVNISVSDAEGKGKQEVVDDLLGDLEDSDDEKENANNEDGADTGEVLWQKSDQVDFASFL